MGAALALTLAGGLVVHARTQPRATIVYTCRTAPATVMDDCGVAAAYATAHDGGASTALSAEADTERHGGSTPTPVWDIREHTPDPIFVEHVSRPDTGTGSGPVLWQSMAEIQTPPAQPTATPTAGGTDGHGGDHGGGDRPRTTAPAPPGRRPPSAPG